MKNHHAEHSRVRVLFFSMMIGGGAFVVYCLTLSPSVAFIDSGELATVAYTLGIAHPTGYPLFTLLGWLVVHLPLPFEEILRLNLLAALLCAGGVVTFFFFVRQFLSVVFRSAEKGRDAGGQHPFLIDVASAGGAGVLAFSETFWSQAQSVEVYSLHVFLLALILHTMMRATFGNDSARESHWLLFAFLTGLGFTNHMTTILLAPGLIVLYFSTQGSSKKSWIRLAVMGIPFVAALSLYLYLPIRSSMGPLLDWGHPTTIERLLRHLSGQQYSVWIFSSPEVAGRQFQYFVGSLPSEFAYAGLGLGLWGVAKLALLHRRLATVTVLLFVACILYSINYDIHDIDSYFLLAYCCIALWSAVGLYEAGRVVGKLIQNRYMVAVVLFLPCMTSAWYHFGANNETGNYLVEDYTKNMFRSVDSNAVVFSYQWDYWVSASLYYQNVMGDRRDVTVIDKELLRRSWYLDQIQRNSPFIIRGSFNEVEAFRKELFKFEHDLPYDPAAIQSRFVRMISSFMRKSIKSRPVYVTSEIEPEFMAGLQKVPSGLAFRLFDDTLYHEPAEIPFKFRPFEAETPLVVTIHRLYSSSLSALGAYYYYRSKDITRSREAFKQSLVYYPANIESKRWLEVLEAGK